MINIKFLNRLSKFNKKLCKNYNIDIFDTLENKSLEKLFILMESKELSEIELFKKICSYSHDVIRLEKIKLSKISDIESLSDVLSNDDFLDISKDFFDRLKNLSIEAEKLLDYIFSLNSEQQKRLLSNTKKIDLLLESFSNKSGIPKKTCFFLLQEIRNALFSKDLLQENELLKISKMKKCYCKKTDDVKSQTCSYYQTTIKPCLTSIDNYSLSLLEEGKNKVTMHFERPKYF